MANGTPLDCTILLVRHAHTEMAGRFCGESDPPLSEQGREQLAMLAQELAPRPLNHIFSSDLQRSQQTARCIASTRGLEFKPMPALREMRFGAWEGLTWDAVSERDPAFAARWMADYPWLPSPGGEEFSSFRERVRQSLAEIAAQSEGECVAVVTHGGVIRTFVVDVLKLSERELASVACPYASFVELRLRAGQWFIKDATSITGMHRRGLM
jgi:alpha-ribazole phosphatase/probable phosphoglycerate mutase